MEKAFEIQKNARDNVDSLKMYLNDLRCWESEMKRREAELSGNFKQDLPPVRSKTRKERPIQAKKKQKNRISSSDYSAWEKFDVDKACEEVDMAEMGPTSLDSKLSQQEKQDKLREEAQYQKERGNGFVRQEKWDDAIACYNRAIELVKDDAIYYANRGLCYLKKNNLHQAEKDCTEALKLDPTYVKALQRRAAARQRLGSLRSASADLDEVLKLEPNNAAVIKQLKTIKTRMGTKGAKCKSSPLPTPTIESKPIATKPPEAVLTPLEKWKNGIGEDVLVINTANKPPHLRSKKALKQIEIVELGLGKPSQKKIDNLAQGDTNNNSSEGKVCTLSAKGDNIEIKPENVRLEKMVPPLNSVQFMNDWKYLKGSNEARSNYLKIIDPANIPSIFANALESDVLSELLTTLYEYKDKYINLSLYLQAFTRVKRFSALAMFLGDNDKLLVNKMLVHCNTKEGVSDDVINELKNKYEL